MFIQQVVFLCVGSEFDPSFCWWVHCKARPMIVRYFSSIPPTRPRLKTHAFYYRDFTFYFRTSFSKKHINPSSPAKHWVSGASLVTEAPAVASVICQSTLVPHLCSCGVHGWQREHQRWVLREPLPFLLVPDFSMISLPCNQRGSVYCRRQWPSSEQGDLASA